MTYCHRQSQPSREPQIKHPNGCFRPVWAVDVGFYGKPGCNNRNPVGVCHGKTCYKVLTGLLLMTETCCLFSDEVKTGWKGCGTVSILHIQLAKLRPDSSNFDNKRGLWWTQNWFLSSLKARFPMTLLSLPSFPRIWGAVKGINQDPVVLKNLSN